MTTGIYNSTPPTLVNGQTVAFQMDSAGRLLVAAPTGSSSNQVQGNVAHDAVDSGNPVKIGGYASVSGPTSVADGDRVNLWLGLKGQGFTAITSQTGGAFADVGGDNDGEVFPNSMATRALVKVKDTATGFAVTPRGDVNGQSVQPAPSANFWGYAGASGGILNTTDVAIKTAAGAGVRNYISSLQFKNTAAVASEIVVKDGSTVIWRGHVSASMTFHELVTFNPPLRGTANTALNVAMLTTATATIVSAQGYTGA